MSIFFLIAAASLAVGPKLAPGVFTTDDYPFEALRTASEGTVSAGVSVDATGAVTACRVLWSSGVPSLDRKTCEVLLARGRFEPARDRRGQAVAAKESIRIKWVVPEDGPSLAADNYHRATFDIAADGTLSNCRFERNGKPLVDTVSQCRYALAELERMPLPDRIAMSALANKVSLIMGEAVGRDEDGSIVKPIAGTASMLGFSATFAIDEHGKARDCKVQYYGDPLRPEQQDARCKVLLSRRFAALPKEEANRGLRQMTSFLLLTIHQ